MGNHEWKGNNSMSLSVGGSVPGRAEPTLGSVLLGPHFYQKYCSNRFVLKVLLKEIKVTFDKFNV